MTGIINTRYIVHREIDRQRKVANSFTSEPLPSLCLYLDISRHSDEGISKNPPWISWKGTETTMTLTEPWSGEDLGGLSFRVRAPVHVVVELWDRRRLKINN